MDNIKILSGSEGVAYCRVSSKDQEKGYSLEFQLEGAKKYALENGIPLAKTWKVTESAKEEGRDAFNEMLKFLKKNPAVKYVLIAKVDRLSRNYADMAAIDELVRRDKKVFIFFHEGFIYHEDSPLSDWIRLDASSMISRIFVRDLQEKTRRGLEEKVKQGGYPGAAPIGYRNVENEKGEKYIEPDPDFSHWAKRIKELSAEAKHSLARIVAILRAEGYPYTTRPLYRNQVERLIRNPLYAGYISWKGNLVKGKHKPIVSWELHEAAIRGLERYGKPKGRKRDFPFAGLIRCGMCQKRQTVVFELKKGKFIYGHCGSVPKKELCPDSKGVRQEIIEEQFVSALRKIKISDEFADFILDEMSKSSGEEAMNQITQEALIKQEIGRLDNRIRQAYVDKVDGTITEEHWRKVNHSWVAEKIRLEEKLKNLKSMGPRSYLTPARQFIELAKVLENKYFSATPSEKREMLDCVLSNLTLVGKNVDFIYKKPFDLFAKGLDLRNCLRA